MNHQNKAKTAPLPHRIMNKTSIYLAHQSKVDRSDYLGYEAIVALEDNQSITIQSSVNLTPQDGKIFEYVLAQWQATLKEQKELKEIVVDVHEIVDALGWNNRTENRKKVIQHLKHLLGVTIIYRWNGGEILFHLLEKVELIDTTKTIAISVSETYQKALENAKSRYINVSDTMALTGKYDIELYKLLQMRGGGVEYRNAKPKLVKNISYYNICSHLHLPINNKISKDTISRAFRNLHKKLRIQQYKYNGNLEQWQTTQLVVSDT